MTTNYNVDWNKRGTNGFGSQFSDTVRSALLVAATDTTVAVPLTAAMGAPTATSFNKFLAVISCNTAADVFLSLNAAAVIPVNPTTPTVFNVGNSVLIPRSSLYCKMVKSTDILHFISSGTPIITVEFYAIQE